MPTPNLLNNEVQDQDRPLSAVGDFASRFNIATPKSVKEPALDKDRPVWARRFNIATPNTPYGASLKVCNRFSCLNLQFVKKKLICILNFPGKSFTGNPKDVQTDPDEPAMLDS